MCTNHCGNFDVSKTGNIGINIKYIRKKLQNNQVIIGITDWLLEIFGFFSSIIPKNSQKRKEPIQYINAAMECTKYSQLEITQ